MLNGHKHAAIEQHIHEQIDARDEETCRQYAEHCANWVDDALVLELCLKLITHYSPIELLEWIGIIGPELAGCLEKIYSHIDKHRAEFIEEEAGNRLKTIKTEAMAYADARAETNAESRRLLR